MACGVFYRLHLLFLFKSKPLILNQGALGKMAFVKALTAPSGTILGGEIFYSLKEAQITVGEWVKH